MTLLNDIQILRDAFSRVGRQLAEEGIANCIHKEYYKYNKIKEAEISLVHLKDLFGKNELLRTENGILLDERKKYLLKNCLNYEDTVKTYIEFLENFRYVFSCTCSNFELLSCDKALQKMKENIPTK